MVPSNCGREMNPWLHVLVCLSARWGHIRNAEMLYFQSQDASQLLTRLTSFHILVSQRRSEYGVLTVH